MNLTKLCERKISYEETIAILKKKYSRTAAKNGPLTLTYLKDIRRDIRGYEGDLQDIEAMIAVREE